MELTVGGQKVLRGTEIQLVFSPSRARSSSKMNFPSLKNCNRPPGALVALIGPDSAPLPLIFPPFPAVLLPCAPCLLPPTEPELSAVPLVPPEPANEVFVLSLPVAAAAKVLCSGCDPSAVGDEADDDDDAGDDWGDTPTTPAAPGWCWRAEGDSNMVAVPLTVVVALVAAVGADSSVIVAHFVRILLIIS